MDMQIVDDLEAIARERIAAQPDKSNTLSHSILALCSELRTAREKVRSVEAAVTSYHAALDRREHGWIAQSRAMHSIESALGMHWVQGATTEREAHPDASP